VNEQKDQRNHQPDDRNGEGETGEDLLHGLNSTIYQESEIGAIDDCRSATRSAFRLLFSVHDHY
jgi:hypothetical protein